MIMGLMHDIAVAEAQSSTDGIAVYRRAELASARAYAEQLLFQKLKINPSIWKLK